MLETIREFALDQLDANGELQAARSAYSEWMLRLAEQAEAALEGPSQREWLIRLDEEHGNVREAVTLALGADDGELALRILIGLDRYWWERPGEAMGWFDRALRLRELVPPSLAAHALRVAGTTAWFYGQPELTLARCWEGLAIFEQLDDERGISLMYSRLVPPLQEAGKLEEADELLEKAVALHRRLGQEQELALALEIVGYQHYDRGQLEEAASVWEESLALSRQIGDLAVVGHAAGAIGSLKIETGDINQGVDLLKEALRIAWDQRSMIAVCSALGDLALAFSAAGNTRLAATFWGGYNRLNHELGPTILRSQRDANEAKLSPAVLADKEGLTSGKTMTTAEAVELALLIESPSSVEPIH